MDYTDVFYDLLNRLGITRIQLGLSDKYLGTNYLAEQMQQSQFAFNSAEAEKDRQWREQMQDKMNAYNSPQATMERLRAAGLNPSLMFGQPVAMSADVPSGAPASGSSGSGGRGSGDAVQDILAIRNAEAQLDLLRAQAADLRASADLKSSQKTYQDYMNKVEDILSQSPIGFTMTSDGLVVESGNVRATIAQRQLEALGLSNATSNLELNDLFWNFYVLAGEYAYAQVYVDAVGNVTRPDVFESPELDRERRALRGDQKVREIAGKLAELEKEAAEAQKAGAAAYAEWLDKNRDNPLVQAMLVMVGFGQSIGLSAPRFSVGTSSNSKRVTVNRK